MKEKLIRADSLLEQIKSPYTEYPIMIGIRKAIKEMIDEAPEIDAIPVEWIKKYIVDNTKTIDEVAGLTVNYNTYPQQIATMLNAWWEEENERNV